MIEAKMGRNGLVVLAFLGGLAGVACDNKDEAKPAPTPSASASAAPSASASAAPSAAPSASASAAASSDGGLSPDAAAHDEAVHDDLVAHHRHHHAGFAGFVLSAIETLGADPPQETAIEGFRKEYKGKAKALHEANAAILGLLADGVAAGKVERAKIEPGIARASTAATAAQAGVQEFLNHVHATLRPEQRAALVDKVDAHWAAWREANEHAAEGGKPDRHLKHLAKELSLTKEQVEKIHASIEADKEANKPFDTSQSDAYIKAFDTAFATDAFDAKKLPATGPDSSKLVSWGAQRMVSFYVALAPVLTPDERTTMADKLRQRAKGPDANKDSPAKEKPAAP